MGKDSATKKLTSKRKKNEQAKNITILTKGATGTRQRAKTAVFEGRPWRFKDEPHSRPRKTTLGGLKKSELMRNDRGRVVSQNKYKFARRSWTKMKRNNPEKWSKFVENMY